MTREEAKDRLMQVVFGVGELDDALDMAIKALEQEPILDKIRAEIEQKLGTHGNISLYNRAIYDVLMILDKYKAESEE